MEANSARKKSIVVSGYYGYRNLGDDAILEMICRDYAQDYDLTVLTLRPRETARRYRVKTVNRFFLPRVLRTVNNADLLLSGGGNLLQDKTSTRSLLYYLFILRMAQRLGVPTMLYAAGLGPIRSAANRARAARVLRNVDLISLREQDSAAFLERLCPGLQPLLTADPVFHMDSAPDAAAEELLRQNGIGEEKLFAVSLRRMRRGDCPRLAELLDRIAVESGCTPVFLAMQEPVDLDAARAVRRLMKQPAHILRGCDSAPLMIAVLRRMKCVVSMRLHALIFGAMASIPLVGFRTDPKLVALLRSLGAPEPIEPGSFDPAQTAVRVAEVIRRAEAPDIERQAALSRELPAAVSRLLEPEKGQLVIHMISGGDTGGAKMHVLSLLQGLQRAGCRVLLVCFMEGSFSEDARAAGIPVRVLPRNDIPGNLRWLKRFIARNGARVLHCHGSRANMYGALLSDRAGVPVVTTIHSDPSLDYLGRPAADLIFGRINRLALKRIGRYVCVSDRLREKMAAAGTPEERIFEIPNGMDFERFEAMSPREDWYAQHGLQIGADAVVFGTAARLSPVKDIGTMIAAFARVIERHPEARLLIAGEGSEEKKLRAAAEKLCPPGTVAFTGWLEDTASFYHAVDVNMLTSLSEGFPYAIPEGGGMRCATIATRVGSIPSVIRDGETGFLLEPGDVDTLTERMCLLVEQPELRRRLGSALFEVVRRDYSLEKMVQTQLEIYDSLSASAGPCQTGGTGNNGG